MRRALSRFLLLFAAALLTSCGGNSLTFIINQQGGEWLLPGGVGLVVVRCSSGNPGFLSPEHDPGRCP